MLFTPKQYASKYLDMDVYVFSGPLTTPMPAAKSAGATLRPVVDIGSWVRIRVGSYRLGAAWAERGGDPKKLDDKKDHYYFSNLTGAVRGRQRIKTKIKRIDGVVESREYDYSEISYALVAPFYGKGYPEDVQLALQMRDRFQKTKFTLQQFAKASFIGLDCNGFVGGYIERRNAQDKWLRKSASKTSARIADLLGPPSRYFTSWDDFRPPGPSCLILGLCDAQGTVKDHTPDGGVGHIVITEPNSLRKHSPTGPVDVEAVESTGGLGLTSGPYRILTMHLDKSKRAFFHVDRGPHKGKEYFRITELIP
ncbi:MAG: hypothetical protein WCA32_19295 [Chromatiaceae bacterium]